MKQFCLKPLLIILSLCLSQCLFNAKLCYHQYQADAKLQLPAGFTATVVAEGLPGARHIAVTKQGGVYIKLSQLKNGKGIIYLKDTNGDGSFDMQTAFGDYPGTGIYIKDDYLYASSNDDVFRYQLDRNGRKCIQMRLKEL